MKIHHDEDADTLELVLSEPYDPSRCETIDVLPFLSVQVTVPKRTPPKGFAIVDEEAYRNNILINRITIRDISLHDTGPSISTIADSAGELANLTTRLAGLANMWHGDDSKADAMRDLMLVLRSVGAEYRRSHSPGGGTFIDLDLPQLGKPG